MAKKTSKKFPKSKTGLVASEPPKLSDDSWKHENDFRTLSDAEEIKGDSERMKYALKHGKKKLKGIKSVMDIVKYRNETYGPKANETEEDDG